MPFTYRAYTHWEAALMAINRPEMDSGRNAEAGDIVVIRQAGPVGGVGLKEMHQFLWIPLYGLDDNDMTALADPWADGTVRYAKRRYKIPFKRLASVDPSFNASRTQDTTDNYQPYYLADEDGFFLIRRHPFLVHGLVWDKATTRYL